MWDALTCAPQFRRRLCGAMRSKALSRISHYGADMAKGWRKAGPFLTPLHSGVNHFPITGRGLRCENHYHF
jgi:hypothetical protein